MNFVKLTRGQGLLTGCDQYWTVVPLMYILIRIFCLRSINDMKENVLYIEILPSDGDVKPGDLLGVFDKSITVSPLPYFISHSSRIHYTTLQHIHNLILHIFLKLKVHINL